MTAALLETLRLAVERIVVGMGYPGIAALMFVENLVPPLPSELVVPFAGFLAASGRLHPVPILVASTFGSVAGALVLYALGARLGEARIRRLLARYGRWIGSSEADLDRVLGAFHTRGGAIVFWARLVPGLRSLVSIPAGLARMPLARFLAFTVLGSLAWNGALLIAGWGLGAQWATVLHLVDRYEQIVWILLAFACVAFVTRALRARSRRGTETLPRG